MILTSSTFASLPILVVGDVMLDRYLYGLTQRISPEAPVPIVNLIEQRDRVGGAANVALNLKGLGANVGLGGIVGEDESGKKLQEILHKNHIITHFIESPSIPTILKQRIISQDHQLIRLDIEQFIPFLLAEALHEALSSAFYQKHYGGIILSDYGKGTISSHQRNWIRAAKNHGIPIFVDPKGNDFSHYQHATLLTPNRKEFEIVAGVCATEDELIQKARAIIKELSLDGLLITRGAEGMTYVCQTDENTFHLPAIAEEVYDVTGAGDTVIAVVAASYVAGMSMREAVRLANLAAGVVVRKMGTAPISLQELQKTLSIQHPTKSGIMQVNELSKIVAAAKTAGEKIVFTNGCFDILHLGHIRYLQEARALGDRLIVAVNDDASVKRLKGSTRPINNLESRMEMLAALEMVDWVVSFSENTPLEVIKQLRPDILVKGGDYNIQEVVGASEVQSWGGEVKALSYYQGYSTTEFLEGINKSPVKETL